MSLAALYRPSFWRALAVPNLKTELTSSSNGRQRSSLALLVFRTSHCDKDRIIHEPMIKLRVLLNILQKRGESISMYTFGFLYLFFGENSVYLHLFSTIMKYLLKSKIHYIAGRGMMLTFSILCLLHSVMSSLAGTLI